MARKLSNRLKTIYDLVDPGVFVSDVGADHGHLVLELVEKGKTPYAQAIDNKPGPFLNMKSNVNASPMGYRIRCSLSDGLSQLSPDCRCIVIAGMGGRLVCSILEKGREKLSSVDTIIADAHRDLVYLRRHLAELGFFIADERLVYEDKIYYSIIKFRKGPLPAYSQADLFFGPVLRKKREPLFLDYLEEQRKKTSDILNKGLDEKARSHYLAVYRLIRDEINRN